MQRALKIIAKLHISITLVWPVDNHSTSPSGRCILELLHSNINSWVQFLYEDLLSFKWQKSIEEIRQLWSHLFCIMGISKLVKRLVHVEMALLFVNSGHKLGMASAAPSPRYKQASPEGAPGQLPSLSQKPLRLTQSMGKPADPGRGAREARGPALRQTTSAAPSPGYKQASPEGAPGRFSSLESETSETD